MTRPEDQPSNGASMIAHSSNPALQADGAPGSDQDRFPQLG
jgi:hypothetical protein